MLSLLNLLRLQCIMLSVIAVTGCEREQVIADSISFSLAAERDAFLVELREDLVFVEGGEFLMGDYGSKYGPEKIPFYNESNNKPLHAVKLSSYSIGAKKITNSQFGYYLKSNGLSLRRATVEEDRWQAIHLPPDNPAHIDWYEADQYCNWLGHISNLPFGLPTEAQWEYAARSRGQYLMVATDDGTYRTTSTPVTRYDGPRGINISTRWDRMDFAESTGWTADSSFPLPVDMFPPNPLGLYAMSDNGLEWVRDWYSPDYYMRSTVTDPQGPQTPDYRDRFGRYLKVVRGQEMANPLWGGGVNVYRKGRDPKGHLLKGDTLFLDSLTARCVVNSAVKLDKPDDT